MFSAFSASTLTRWVRSLRFVDARASFRSTYTYTNITHIMAGRLVARAEGAKDWGSILQSELLDRLGMKSTSYTRAAIDLPLTTHRDTVFRQTVAWRFRLRMGCPTAGRPQAP